MEYSLTYSFLRKSSLYLTLSCLNLEEAYYDRTKHFRTQSKIKKHLYAVYLPGMANTQKIVAYLTVKLSIWEFELDAYFLDIDLGKNIHMQYIST